MRLAKSAASVLAMAVSAAAIAEGYVGAGVGATRVDLEDSGVSFDGDDTGWKLFGGYKVNDNLGLEIAYYDFGKPDDDVFGTDINIKVDGYGAFLAGFYPLAEQVEVFARLGFVNYDVKARGGGVTASDDGTAVAWGVGGSYRFTGQFSLAAEWERVEVDDGDVDMISLSGRFHF